jgi:hypothetical protein
VVAHYCYAITIATQDHSGCSILLKTLVSKPEQFCADTKSPTL